MSLFILAIFPLLTASTVLSPSSEGQTSDSGNGVIFIPDGLLFPPLAANPQEPRMGLRKEIGSSRMELDIGGILDILEFAPSSGDRFRLGVSFFTYALTTSNQGLRLQVDAVDGFFGGHLTYRKSFKESSAFARLRILHVSAHFVDGHFDSGTNSWKDGIEPIPYTKDFGELLVAYSCPTGWTEAMVYAGVSYATLVRPEEIRRVSGLLGLEIRTLDEDINALGKPLILYAAYNLSLSGIPAYIETNTLEAGMKFGRWSGSGIRVYASYHRGLEVFGQYFDSQRSYWGLGFTFDMW